MRPANLDVDCLVEEGPGVEGPALEAMALAEARAAAVAAAALAAADMTPLPLGTIGPDADGTRGTPPEHTAIQIRLTICVIQ